MCKTEIRHSNLYEATRLNKKSKNVEKNGFIPSKDLRQVIKFTFCLSTVHWASTASFHISYVLS